MDFSTTLLWFTPASDGGRKTCNSNHIECCLLPANSCCRASNENGDKINYLAVDQTLVFCPSAWLSLDLQMPVPQYAGICRYILVTMGLMGVSFIWFHEWMSVRPSVRNLWGFFDLLFWNYIVVAGWRPLKTMKHVCRNPNYCFHCHLLPPLVNLMLKLCCSL